MRYFLVKYSKKPTGQMDEVVSVSKKIKLRDSQSSAVILDFKTRQVIQASMDGVTVPKDWNRIRDFYHQHYARLIEDLEAVYPVITDKDLGST
jgi:hypothetical protein